MAERDPTRLHAAVTRPARPNGLLSAHGRLQIYRLGEQSGGDVTSRPFSRFQTLTQASREEENRMRPSLDVERACTVPRCPRSSEVCSCDFRSYKWMFCNPLMLGEVRVVVNIIEVTREGGTGEGGGGEGLIGED